MALHNNKNRISSRYFLKKKCLVFIFVASSTFIFIQGIITRETAKELRITFTNWMLEYARFLSPSYFYNSRTCTRETNISFTKTHKTGSSSIQNMLLRFALTYNEIVLLPLRENYFGNPAPFDHAWAPKLKEGLTYNILCHHHRFNKNEIEKVMPSNTIYITIIRNPIEVFESLYSYYDLYKYYHVNLATFASSAVGKNIHEKRVFGRFGRNQISFDLGMKDEDFNNETKIMDFIHALDDQFDLVMVNEMMNESLILLKELLCWSVDDIVVFHHNARLPRSKTVLKKQAVDVLKQVNNADVLLYDYFVEVLKRKINEFGKIRMEREVAELKKRTDEWFEFCIDDLKPAKYLKGEFRPYHPETYGFHVRDDVKNITCEALSMSELGFTRKLRTRQNSSYAYSESFV